MAVTAVATSAASGAAISTINNRGDLGAVFKDVTSAESLKNYAIAGASAGFGGYMAGTDASFMTQMGTRLAVSSALKTVSNGGNSPITSERPQSGWPPTSCREPSTTKWVQASLALGYRPKSPCMQLWAA